MRRSKNGENNMKKRKVITCYFCVSIVCIFLFLGCSDKSLSQSQLNNVNLNEWVGDYEFYEFCPPNINMQYNINIYKENEAYFVKINIDGFQTNVRLQAKVSGDEKSIKLLHDKHLPDNQFKPYNKGDILLSFEKRNSKIYTNWGKLEPILPENKASGKVYFTKMEK